HRRTLLVGALAGGDVVPRREDVLDAARRHLRREVVLDVALEVVAELVGAAAGLAQDGGEARGRLERDDRRTLLLERGARLGDEGVVVEGGGGGGRDLAGRAGGRRVGRVDADDGVQGHGGVGDAAGDRAGGVLAEGERDDPVAAHEPDGRAHADELVVGRR